MLEPAFSDSRVVCTPQSPFLHMGCFRPHSLGVVVQPTYYHVMPLSPFHMKMVFGQSLVWCLCVPGMTLSTLCVFTRVTQNNPEQPVSRWYYVLSWRHGSTMSLSHLLESPQAAHREFWTQAVWCWSLRAEMEHRYCCRLSEVTSLRGCGGFLHLCVERVCPQHGIMQV